MICSEATLVNGSPEIGKAVTLRCRCWACEICQPFNRASVIRRIASGEPTSFMTLTVDANRFPSPARAAREMVRAFARLRRRIVNRYNIKHLAYFVTVEATKQGWPHMHIALRSKWIGQRWLSEQWADLLGSPIVDIRRVQDGGRAARYLAKYLGKDPHRFEGCKRFWCSRDWNDSKHPEPPAPACFGDRWWRRSESLAQLEAVCLARGCATVLTAHSLTWEAGFP